MPAPLTTLSRTYLQPEQEAQHSAEEQQRLGVVAAAAATPRAMTDINSITFNLLMDFSPFSEVFVKRTGSSARCGPFDDVLSRCAERALATGCLARQRPLVAGFHLRQPRRSGKEERREGARPEERRPSPLRRRPAFATTTWRRADSTTGPGADSGAARPNDSGRGCNKTDDRLSRCPQGLAVHAAREPTAAVGQAKRVAHNRAGRPQSRTSSTGLGRKSLASSALS